LVVEQDEVDELLMLYEQEIRFKAFNKSQKTTDENHATNNSSDSNTQLGGPNELIEKAKVQIGSKRGATVIVLKTSEEIIKEELAALASDEINLAPKKINWDLKKQIESKLDKLKRRTQRAVVDLLRERLASQTDDE